MLAEILGYVLPLLAQVLSTGIGTGTVEQRGVKQHAPGLVSSQREEEVNQPLQELTPRQPLQTMLDWDEAASRGGAAVKPFMTTLQSNNSSGWQAVAEVPGRIMDKQETKALASRNNLNRWRASGQPSVWVKARKGQWNDQDWKSLLASLERSEFWPMERDAVGKVLEEELATLTNNNLNRWRASGQPRAWVEARKGQWGDKDWRLLLEALKRSEFWPIKPDDAGMILEELKRDWHEGERKQRNLILWQESGQPWSWVEKHKGQWKQEDLRSLFKGLKISEFWPMELSAVRRILEELKRKWQERERNRQQASLSQPVHTSSAPSYTPALEQRVEEVQWQDPLEELLLEAKQLLGQGVFEAVIGVYEAKLKDLLRVCSLLPGSAKFRWDACVVTAAYALALVRRGQISRASEKLNWALQRFPLAPELLSVKDLIRSDPTAISQRLKKLGIK